MTGVVDVAVSVDMVDAVVILDAVDLAYAVYMVGTVGRVGSTDMVKAVDVKDAIAVIVVVNMEDSLCMSSAFDEVGTVGKLRLSCSNGDSFSKYRKRTRYAKCS